MSSSSSSRSSSPEPYDALEEIEDWPAYNQREDDDRRVLREHYAEFQRRCQEKMDEEKTGNSRFTIDYEFGYRHFHTHNTRKISKTVLELGVGWEYVVDRVNGALMVQFQIREEDKKLVDFAAVRYQVRILYGPDQIMCGPMKNVKMTKGVEDAEWKMEKAADWNELWKRVGHTVIIIDVFVEVENIYGTFKRPRLPGLRNCGGFWLYFNNEEDRILVDPKRLASVSPVFKEMLKIEEPFIMKRSLAVGYEFQYFLEALYSLPKAINDSNVESIMDIAEKYKTQCVLDRCETFLFSYSKKSKDELSHLVLKFNLDRLRRLLFPNVNHFDGAIENLQWHFDETQDLTIKALLQSVLKTFLPARDFLKKHEMPDGSLEHDIRLIPRGARGRRGCAQRGRGRGQGGRGRGQGGTGRAQGGTGRAQRERGGGRRGGA